MLHRLANTMQVVDADIADPGKGRPDIDEHQWDPARFQVLEQQLLHPERHYRHAVDAAFDHAPDRTCHQPGVVDRRGQQNLVAMLNRNLLECLNDLGEEWIGDFRDDQTEDSASSGDQRPGLGIRVVSQFIDYFPHAPGQLGIYGRNAIDGARCRGRRNPGASRDFPEIHIVPVRARRGADGSIANLYQSVYDFCAVKTSSTRCLTVNWLPFQGPRWDPRGGDERRGLTGAGEPLLG